MTRSQIDELSQNLIFLINEMEDVLMKKIAAQLVSDGDVSDSSKWRIRQLARAGKLDKEALKTIKSYMSAQSEMLEDALYNAALSEIGNVDEMAKDAAARGLVDGRVKAPADRTAQSALKSYLKQAKSDLNMVNTVMRYKTKQAYVSAVNNTFWTLDKEQRVHDALGMGALEVISGTESFQTAVRDVLKKLSEKGIPAFIDAGGHEWKPETYVQMDLRTTMGNTARAAQWQRCDDFGVDLIEVDSHLGAREKCARDQGKIYSRSGQSGTCKDGSGNVVYYYAFSSTSFGQPDGLFGINCRHNSYPYIPGVSYQRYFPVDEEENAKRYKEYQTQRALERKIRESKRECMLLSEAGDEEGLKKAALTLRNRKENYSAYSKAHDLRVHNDRTQVYGYDRSKSMKTVWAEKKAQSASGGSSAPAPSGGKAVTVNVPAPASSGKAYTGEKIVKPLDNGGGSGIMKETTKVPAKTLSLSNLNEFEEWQNKYYDYNSGVSFSREDNPNIFTYTGGAYDVINALERGGEQLERAKRCYRNGLSEYEGIGNKISEELSKFKLPEPINVRRAVGNVDYITGATSSVEDMKNSIGKVFTEKGFTSTTICSDAMLAFASGEKTKFTRATLDIYVPPNSRGAYIYKISERPAEFEYLLDRNTKFIVIDAGEREVVNKYTGETTIERFMKLEVIPDD